MNESDRRLVTDTMLVMNALRSDMQEFRGEMKEFKNQTLERITTLEEDQVECQKNPSVCSTARLLESHISGHQGNRRNTIALWAVCVSGLMFLYTVLTAIFKRS